MDDVGNGRFRHKIFGILLFTMIIAISIIVILLSRQVYREVWENEYDSIHDKTSSAAEFLSTTMKDNLMMLKLYGRNCISKESFDDKTTLISHLDEFSKETDMTVALIDQQGIGYNSYGEKLDLANYIDVAKLMSSSEGIAEPKEDTYFAGAAIFLYTKITVADSGDYLLIAFCSTDRIKNLNEITFYGKKGYSYLVNKDGKLILTSANDKTEVFTNLYDFVNIASDREQLRESMENGESGYEGYLCGDIQESTICYMPVKNINGWYLVTIIPQNYINSSTSAIIYRVISICICFSLSVIIVIINNVGLAKKNERLEVDSAKADAKNKFLSHVSHEIRTPMNAIIGMTELSQKEINNKPKLEENLNNIKCASDYMLSLINNILDMSRIQNVKIELDNTPFRMIDVVETVNKVTSQNMKLKNIRMSITKDSPLSTVVIGDRKKLTQILINIISNSVKFSHVSGKLRFVIHTEHERDDITYIFKIIDEGIGIKKENLSKIFEPFEQADSAISTSYGGSGLGLAICKAYIELMQGTVNVESEYGHGTIFTICIKLPKAPSNTLIETEDKAEDVNNLHTIDKENLNILLVDDNEMNLQVMSTMLEYDGHKVTTAKNGQEAVDKFRDSKLDSFDVILMDVRMPVKDGLQATREIRDLARTDAKCVKIIALTANAFTEDLDKTKEAGMNFYITKPVKMDIIRERLKNL